MLSDNVKILLLFAFFIVVIYIYFISNNLEATFLQDIANNSMVEQEGFEGGGRQTKNVVEHVESILDKLDDELRVNRYRKDYEDLLDNSEELFELIRLKSLTGLIDVDANNIHNALHLVGLPLYFYEGALESIKNCRNYIDGK